METPPVFSKINNLWNKEDVLCSQECEQDCFVPFCPTIFRGWKKLFHRVYNQHHSTECSSTEITQSSVGQTWVLTGKFFLEATLHDRGSVNQWFLNLHLLAARNQPNPACSSSFPTVTTLIKKFNSKQSLVHLLQLFQPQCFAFHCHWYP